jgi:hypothetical protein
MGHTVYPPDTCLVSKLNSLQIISSTTRTEDLSVKLVCRKTSSSSVHYRSPDWNGTKFFFSLMKVLP